MAPLAIVGVYLFMDIFGIPVALDTGLGLSDVLDLAIPANTPFVARIAIQRRELKGVQVLSWWICLVTADAGGLDLEVVDPLGCPCVIEVTIPAIFAAGPMDQVQ
jgi:hypothetical protein